jgi:Flp pilus assembly protein TadB
MMKVMVQYFVSDTHKVMTALILVVLPFTMKVMVQYFVSDTHKVMTALILVVFVLVAGTDTLSMCYCGVFSAMS